MAVDVDAALPEVTDVDDPDLRAGVREVWATAADAAGVEDLTAVPWLPPVQRAHGIEDETLVGHVGDVAACSLALAGALERRDANLDRDLLLAGALVHDVSKLREFDGTRTTPAGDLLGHPYVGVHCVLAAGLPVECAHVVLSHTHRTTVEPAFLEAELVRRADEVATAAILSGAGVDLRDA